VSSAQSEINQTAGRNIRSIREKMGLSQDVFADRCGIHRSYVGAIERGESNITLDTLARVAAAAGIKPQALLNYPAAAASHDSKKTARGGAPTSRGKRK
jgi:transcriptional regulator with XRE-family HTH domain